MPGFLSGFPVWIRRRVTGTRMGLTSFRWDCTGEEVEMQKRSCSWHVTNEAAVGRMPWGPWPPSQWSKGPFFGSSVCLDSDKTGFTPTKLPFIFPAASSLCLLNWGRRLLLLEHCLPRCWVFLFTVSAEWTGGAETETWTEEQKLNVASERINNQD